MFHTLFYLLKSVFTTPTKTPVKVWDGAKTRGNYT